MVINKSTVYIMAKEKDKYKSIDELPQWKSIFDKRLFNEKGKLLCLSEPKYYSYFGNVDYGFVTGYISSITLELAKNSNTGKVFFSVHKYFLKNGKHLFHEKTVEYSRNNKEPKKKVNTDTTMWETSKKAGIFYSIKTKTFKTGELTDRERQLFKSLHCMNVARDIACKRDTMDISDVNEWLMQEGSDLRVISLRKLADVLNSKLPKIKEEPKKEIIERPYRKLLKKAPIRK